MKKAFFEISKSPFESLDAMEAIDMAMMAATMDQHVTIFFSGDGIQNLIEVEDDKTFHRKNLTKTCKALPLYDVECLVIDVADVQRLGLEVSKLSVAVDELSSEDIEKLKSNSDYKVRF